MENTTNDKKTNIDTAEKKKITIVGSGFVGKATGNGLMSKGHDVTFVDINDILIEKLNQQGLTACNIGSGCANDRDIYMICVMTPTINDHLDYRFIESSLASLGQAIKSNTNHPIIVIRSTVLPGSIEGNFKNIIEEYSGLREGEGFSLAMNPEFLREVSAEKDFANPWIVVLGTNNAKTAQTLEDLYRPFKAPIVHMSIKEAEMMKYVHNIYNAAKISFFNEMRMISERVGVDADKVFLTVMQSAEASWNPKYGIRDMGPYDGSCLPKDTSAFLSWSDEKVKKKMPLLHAVIKVNEDLKGRHYLEY